MATVSLCMIVRDEERHLPDCLACCADLVDEIVIVDTGSTDRTKQIAAAARDKHGQPAKVFDFCWVDDFSAARNESLRHATSDWIFWMDADDRLLDADRDRFRVLTSHLADDTDLYVFGLNSVAKPGSMPEIGSHIRLFRRLSQVQWTGRIHEHLTGIKELYGSYADVVVTHTGFLDHDRRQQKVRRNLRIWEMELAANPDREHALYYVGGEYARAGDYAKAIDLGRRAKSDPRYEHEWRNEYPHLLRLLAWCYGNLGCWTELAEIKSELVCLGDNASLEVLKNVEASFPSISAFGQFGGSIIA